MMQSAGGMNPPPMDQQIPPTQQQPWQMMPPSVPPPAQQQYYQQPLPMWGQQPSQIAPPQTYQQPPPQQYQQPQQQQQIQYPPQGQQAATTGEIRTLWIGDLQFWMDENYVNTCFSQVGQVLSVKLIRNKQTGQLEGYGFIEFVDRATAERVLQTYNGQIMPSTDQPFRLNWASLSAGDRRRDDTADYTIFVGDLASDVTDFMLQEVFRNAYPSIKGAKIVTDRDTGRSKGYGFVRFGDPNEQARAMTEMNGMYCSSRAMRIGPATTKKSMGAQQEYSGNAPYQATQGTQSESDPNNTTIFVGGLDLNVSEELLKQLFSQYGELVHVKIPAGKRCGFVQFANRACAEEALLMLQGTQLGDQKIRLSWGRTPSNKQTQQDPNQYNGNYYGYAQQGYEAYGYAQPPQDTNAYAYGAFPGYGGYQQQQ